MTVTNEPGGGEGGGKRQAADYHGVIVLETTPSTTQPNQYRKRKSTHYEQRSPEDDWTQADEDCLRRKALPLAINAEDDSTPMDEAIVYLLRVREEANACPQIMTANPESIRIATSQHLPAHIPDIRATIKKQFDSEQQSSLLPLCLCPEPDWVEEFARLVQKQQNQFMEWKEAREEAHIQSLLASNAVSYPSLAETPSTSQLALPRISDPGQCRAWIYGKRVPLIPPATDKVQDSIQKSSERFAHGFTMTEPLSPTPELLTMLDQSATLRLLHYHSEWLLAACNPTPPEEKAKSSVSIAPAVRPLEFTELVGFWIFSLLMHLDPLLGCDDVFIVRNVGKACVRTMHHLYQNWLSNPTGAGAGQVISSHPHVAMLHSILVVVCHHYGQKDLLKFAVAPTNESSLVHQYDEDYDDRYEGL